MTTQISIEEYIELLQYKLDALKKAKAEDGTWNYPIEETEEKIEMLRGML